MGIIRQRTKRKVKINQRSHKATPKNPNGNWWEEAWRINQTCVINDDYAKQKRWGNWKEEPEDDDVRGIAFIPAATFEFKF